MDAHFGRRAEKRAAKRLSGRAAPAALPRYPGAWAAAGLSDQRLGRSVIPTLDELLVDPASPIVTAPYFTKSEPAGD